MSPDIIQNILCENKSLKSEIVSLKDELSELKRMIFGQKRERYIPAENQLSFDFGEENTNEPDELEEVSYQRRKPKKRKGGREEIPNHLPRKTIIIEPECDTTGMVKVSEKKTEQLEYKSAEFYVTQIIRPLYLDDTNGERKLICAELPPLCIDKGKAGPTLVARTLVSKCEDHTPLYRIVNQVKRDCGMTLPKSSVEDWFKVGCTWVSAIATRMNEIMMTSNYIQIDESYLKVMIKPTNGKSSRGYMWSRHSPGSKIVIFNYNKNQNSGVAKMLIGNNYVGNVQSDGLQVYDFLDERENIDHFGCNGHARRKFEKSLGNDKVRSDYALKMFGKLFEVEKEAKDKGLSSEERLLLRREKSVPVWEKLKEWLDTEIHNISIKNNIGKAFMYTLNRWKELTRYLENGEVEISNNLIENLYRPLALGRRNWLFAGSEKGAQRLADAYSVILTCKLHGVNSFKYLSDILKKLPLRKARDIDDLLPWNWTEPKEER
jgi:transposase